MSERQRREMKQNGSTDHPLGHGGSGAHAPRQHGNSDHFDLAQAALDEMHEAGFRPEFGPGVAEQVKEIRTTLAAEFRRSEPGYGVPDLRSLCWSSIDNDTSRDLDQIEVAERVADGIRVHVAIGDVARAVEKDSPIDQHAKAQTQTIYTAVKNFPMLPLELSTGLTSLNENGDRLAVMMSFTVGNNGQMTDEQVSSAWVCNHGQFAYSRVGPFLEQHAGATNAAGITPEAIAELRSDSARQDHPQTSAFADTDQGRRLASELAEQLLLQDQATQALHRA